MIDTCQHGSHCPISLPAYIHGKQQPKSATVSTIGYMAHLATICFNLDSLVLSRKDERWHFGCCKGAHFI